MSNFQKDNIGKFIYRQRLGGENIFDLLIITGYDYFTERYYGHYICHGLWGRDEYNYIDTRELDTALTYTDTVDLLNSKINKLQEQINDILKFVDRFDISKYEHENERNELQRLQRSYKECVNEKNLYEKLKPYHTEYEKELQRVVKSLKRIEKRFYHYFKADAKDIIRCLDNIKCLSGMRYAQILYQNDVLRLNKILSRIDFYKDKLYIN